MKKQIVDFEEFSGDEVFQKRSYLPVDLTFVCPHCEEKQPAMGPHRYFFYGEDLLVEECGICEETINPPFVLSIESITVMLVREEEEDG